uniref:Uncharacterized protein n=1 Tax=Salix viminalis TaxID=40686 RepID=A0A6N2KHW2_SALVM
MKHTDFLPKIYIVIVVSDFANCYGFLGSYVVEKPCLILKFASFFSMKAPPYHNICNGTFKVQWFSIVEAFDVSLIHPRPLRAARDVDGRLLPEGKSASIATMMFQTRFEECQCKLERLLQEWRCAASNDNRTQPTIARIEALENDYTGMELVEAVDDDEASLDDDDDVYIQKKQKGTKRKTRQTKALENARKAPINFLELLHEANLEALPPHVPSYMRAAMGPPSSTWHFYTVCGTSYQQSVNALCSI